MFLGITTDASVQTEIVTIMQHVNKLSRSTHWKDLAKSTKRKGCQTDFSKFQMQASTETSMERMSKSFIFKLSLRGNSPSWNPKILPYCQKFGKTSSLEYYWFFSDAFMSRGKHFQGDVNIIATINFSAEKIYLFSLFINNFNLKKFCSKNWISAEKHHVFFFCQ